MDIPLYRQWLENPTVNPLTGRKIKIDGPMYRKYKNVCDRLGIGGAETITRPISISKDYRKFATTQPIPSPWRNSKRCQQNSFPSLY